MEPTSVQPLDYAKPGTSNRPAAASLIAGLLLFIPFVPGLVAIIYGRKGQKLAIERAGAGQGMARAGLVLGVINLALWFLLSIASVPVVIKARQAARQSACLSNMRQVAVGMMLYANQNNGYLPPSLDVLVAPGGMLSTTQVLACPETGKPAPPVGGPYDYIYVAEPVRLSKIKQVASYVTVIEPLGNHAGRGMTVAWGDGHITFEPPAAAQAILAKLAADGRLPNTTVERPSENAPAE